MPLDTPATVAVIGAGPLGLEAALYGRYLGYTVAIYERDHVAAGPRAMSRARMLSPFVANRSALGLAALAAQDPDWQPPGDDALLTCGEYAGRYLLPLAASDLLDGSIHEGARVLAVAADHTAQRVEPVSDAADEGVGDADEEDLDDESLVVADGGEEEDPPPFRLLLEDAEGERTVMADAVIDATGLSEPLGLGPGGIPAIGERKSAAHLFRGVPDALGRDRARFAGRRVLVVGAELTAAWSIAALAELAGGDTDTRVIWITSSCADADPVPLIPDDPLPERDRLRRAANAAARENRIEHWPATAIDRIRWKRTSGQFAVRTCGARREKLKVDCVLSCTGRRHVPLLCDTMPGGAALRYFTLAPWISVSRPTIAAGLEQIRDIFAALVGRSGLDLYATAAPRT
jgi:hypothetical protein